MRKPQNIILTIVGGVVAAAVGIKACSPVTHHRSYSYSPQAAQQRAQREVPQREYDENEYISGGGYFHPMAQRFFPYPVNHHDTARGYYHAGIWNAAPAVISTRRAMPLASELQRLQQLLAQQYQRPQQYSSSGSSSSFRSSGVSSVFRPRYSGGSSSSSSSDRPSSSSSSSSSSGTRSFFGGFGGSSSSSS